MNILSWNINGVKQKFSNSEVVDVFRDKDIVVITESHFNVRVKCPDGFIFCGRSKPIESKQARGGVAVYRNLHFQFNVDVITDIFRDAVVLRVRNTNLVIAAVYIPPYNSDYYDDISFRNCELIMEHFSSMNTLIVGDLNSRVGCVEGIYTNVVHKDNPDGIINRNGKILREICQANSNYILLNGYSNVNKNFDSKYTFYRGALRSQVDTAISNNVQMVESFSIMEKCIYSDHCPVVLSCSVPSLPSLITARDCADGLFSYDHYNVNRIIRNPVPINRLNVPKVVDALNELAENLRIQTSSDDINVDQLNASITNGIYAACMNNCNEKLSEVEEKPNFKNCNSSHFKAMASVNLYSYEIYSRDDPDAALTYLENWMKYENLALRAENNELNVKCNVSWSKLKHDKKKMWNVIDWKGRSESTGEKKVNESQIKRYFKNIFQSKKTLNNPTVSDVVDVLSAYDCYVPVLDDALDIDELDRALKSIKRGVSFDGLPPQVLLFLPPALKEVILILMQTVFCGDYPREWRLQILHALTKHGHTYENPQLRGIAVAALFCRVYDTILDNRFILWYRPNKEQSGFREFQGCLLPIFILIMLIVYCKENGKNLFVGFLDYEKAFDYANRSQIVLDLMGKGCGKTYLQAVSNMFAETSYAPKTGKNLMGEGISSTHGVTQGRKSSTNLFSFYVSDMGKALDTVDTLDFNDPYSLAQLADDTALIAEYFMSLSAKMNAIFNYSDRKYQVPNVKKTLYANFCEDPETRPMPVGDTFINSIKDGDYNYLGMLFLATNLLSIILKYNISKRMMHIAKYYAWLDINENTPIETKLNVFDSCCMQALLYGCEAWGDISCIEEKLVATEMKVLKRILNVKSSTCNELVYFELKRSDCISMIKDQQYNFFKKLKLLSTEDAVLVNFLELCKESSILKYYENLSGNNRSVFTNSLNNTIESSTKSRVVYYRDLIQPDKSSIYTSFLNDYFRKVISRWRLSCHKLKIETLRYSRPFVEREDRKCVTCGVLEDESHVIFHCPVFDEIRVKFQHLLSAHTTIESVLNPTSETIVDTAKLLHAVDDMLNDDFIETQDTT